MPSLPTTSTSRVLTSLIGILSKVVLREDNCLGSKNLGVNLTSIVSSLVDFSRQWSLPWCESHVNSLFLGVNLTSIVSSLVDFSRQWSLPWCESYVNSGRFDLNLLFDACTIGIKRSEIGRSHVQF